MDEFLFLFLFLVNSYLRTYVNSSLMGIVDAISESDRLLCCSQSNACNYQVNSLPKRPLPTTPTNLRVKVSIRSATKFVQ